MKKRSQRKKGNNRREMACISVVLVVLMAFMLVVSNRLREKNENYEATVALLNQQIEAESERAQEIEELREYVQTPEYAGQAARERLGMVGENEILFRAEN